MTSDILTPPTRTLARADRMLLLALSALPVIVHLTGVASRHYGYFIDEFYYFACASRLAFGYVDHPPLAPLVLALTRPVLGDSLLAIRVLPFLASGATAWVTGLLVHRLGGGRVALATGALSMGLMPVFLAMTGFFSMNAFEPLLWSLTMLVLVHLVQTGNSRLWLLVGLLIGLGFQNKHTIIGFVAALGIGIVATRSRRMLRDPWLWVGASAALLVALPNLVWQIQNGWPSLEFYRNAQLLKNVYSPPWRSIAVLALVANPVALPVWLGGLWWLVGSRDARPIRFLAVMAIVVLVQYVASGTSRPDRPLAVFPLLMAAGGLAVERVLHLRAARTPVVGTVVRTAVWTVVGTAAIAGLLLAPLVSPILPPPVVARYAAAVGLTYQAERGKSSPIPQLLADRTGWESFADDVERVYRSLPAKDQRQAILYAPSYGQAGALELWGPARGLPRVIASQNTYWHWSAGRTNTEVLIAVDADPDDLRAMFREVWQAGWVDCDYCMSWRNHVPIFVARGSIRPIEGMWARARHYE